MKKFGGVKKEMYLHESNHDLRATKDYRGTKSHARFEAKKHIQREVEDAKVI